MRLGAILLFAAATIAACGGSTSSNGSGGNSGAGGSSGASGSSGAGGGGGASGSGAAGGNPTTGGTGGAQSPTSCNAKGTCALVASQCCGYCSPTPLSGFLALNEKSVASYQEQLCADPVACPDCETWEEPHFLAVCRGGQCAAIDLRTDELSACSSDGDCVLRYGSGCCEECAGTAQHIVAYNKSAGLLEEVCSPNAGPCPPCVPPPLPHNLVPMCSDGHCIAFEVQH